MKMIQLQSIGWQPATEAKNIKVGDILIWNFGGTEKIEKMEKSKTGKTLILTVLCEDQNTYTRRLSVNTLVAVKGL